MTKDLETRLKRAQERLERALAKVLATRGYVKDSAQLKMLHEMVKEQMPNENTRLTTRQAR